MTQRAVMAVCLLMLAANVSAQQGVSDGEWRHSNGDAGATRYAALDQITAANAGDLRVAWEWAGANFGPTPEFKSETTPLMVDGVLYFSAGLRRDVIAINAGTGETLWIHRFDEGARGLAAPRRNSGRGVSYWTDGQGDERIFVITPGFHLIALDAATGLPMPNFGNDGIVDMKRGFDQPVALDEQNLGSSSPGMVFEDLIIVGPAMAGSGRPASQVGVPSHITAWDTRTGERRWIFHTVPKPGEFGYDTWENDSAQIGGNAGAWAPLALDEELGYVYLPLEVATSDYYGGHRLGDNLFSSSLVCLDARTGERVWHFQTVHHDVYEYDNPSAPILMDVTVDGLEVPAVVQLTKQSLVFAFDRVTGDPLWPIEELPVPASDVPGERTSPTQPFPTKPAPLDQQGATEDDLIDLTPELRAEALEIAGRFRLGPLYASPSLAEADDGTIGTFQVPGTAGGALWEGGAVDVESGVLYVGTTTGLTVLSLTHDPDASDVEYISAGVRVAGPQGLPLFKPPFGRITAIDMNTGEHLWMKPNGGTPAAIRNHPALAGVDFPPTGSRTRALLLATPTLLFAGEGWGGEPYFRAYDKASGEIVAEIELPATVSSLPMTYMHDGTQFIVFAAGDRRTGQPGKLLALALPDDSQ
ncbi:MAG: hypothetical protein CL476_04690 [Acidobacteria bacterium]|jgi:quinoprotein glucose dehydrogenase|nr:hypothetical protein [Acidobacteriota bacterium]